MNWANYWDYKLPDPKTSVMADYMLAYAVRSDLSNADVNFLSGTMGPQYDNPSAYISNMIRYAISLTQNNFAIPYAPTSWDPVMGAMQAVFSCFDMLKQLPVNRGDEATASVYDAWISGKGKLYGGHDPISATPGVSSGGQQPVPQGATISILGQIQK